MNINNAIFKAIWSQATITTSNGSSVLAYVYHVPCSMCHRTSNVWLEKASLDAYNKGASVKEAFSYMTKEELRFAITLICNECWLEIRQELQEDECSCLPDKDPCPACVKRSQEKHGDQIPF